jgi:pimeloyl-ACP methyl ester carboxylesterase
MRRLLLIAVAVVLSIPLAGASYEALASAHDAGTYPAPGVLVDVDGRRMHLNCVGEGSPTIILDAGLGGSSLDWNLVQPELARTTRTCSYDRAGMGWSDPAPGRRTPEQIATELASLLDRAGIEGPYVLVAHSLAGKNARLFAMRQPEDVAGMVLIDPRHEYVDEHTTDEEERTFRDNVAGQATQYSLARRLGIVRLFGSNLAGVPAMEETVRRQIAIVATNSSAIEASSAEAAERAGSDELLHAAPSLGQTPLIVLAAGQSMNEPRWAEAQRRMSVLSDRGRLIVAQGSSHAVEWDQAALVIATVREVVTEAQGDARPS